MKPKISLLLIVFSVFISAGFVSAKTSEVKRSRHMKDVLASVIPETNSSIWESFPVKSDSVNIQVLDKISGKVSRSKLNVEQPARFGTITINLEKAFVNSPDDMDEVYAYIKIKENEEVIFSDWLFASSPSVNLFMHPVYDIRVEF